MARSANLPQSPERNSTSPTTPISEALCLPTCRPSPDLHQTRINVSAQKTQQNATMNQNRTNVSAQKDTVVNYFSASPTKYPATIDEIATKKHQKTFPERV